MGDTGSLALGGFVAASAFMMRIPWFIPLFGLPISIVGLVLGIKSVKSEKRGMAIAGIVMSSIGLVLTIINGALGAYLAATGQVPGLG